MNNHSEILVAQTHTPEYLLHKYWARKPHNIISYFIQSIVPENGVILDPFCGSGVTLRESQKLGISATGLDINPIAVLNSKVLTNAPDGAVFYETISSIIDKITPIINSSYSTPCGGTIKYLVHLSQTQCSNCLNVINYNEAKKEKRKSVCPHCNNELKFNIESFCGSKIQAICVDGQKTYIDDAAILKIQEEKSSEYLFGFNFDDYNFDFIENRRILSYKGMKTNSLFTNRNFSILCYLAKEFENIKDVTLQNAALLFLTASVAQCSRLIPSRNNLSTGGPSWSVPGFWVPGQHLETNPLVHLKARLKKFTKGLNEIAKHPAVANIDIQNEDCLSFLATDKTKYDMIFLDPPYGDNVPYTEFSVMWNSFLKKQPNYNDDFSVSDRMSRDKSWSIYQAKLDKLLLNCQNNLTPTGKLLITFNNNDLKAWESLLGALQKNNFVCEYVTYVIPAVISSKAQFSPKGSYVSDIYSIYRLDCSQKLSYSLNVITDALIRCSIVRNGVIAKNLVYRTIMIEWIKNNISCSLLKEIPAIVSTLFRSSNDMYEYTGTIPPNTITLDILFQNAAKELLSNGPCEWNDLYKILASKYLEYGFIDANELRSILNDHIIFSKSKCIAYKK